MAHLILTLIVNHSLDYSSTGIMTVKTTPQLHWLFMQLPKAEVTPLFLNISFTVVTI